MRRKLTFLFAFDHHLSALWLLDDMKAVLRSTALEDVSER